MAKILITGSSGFIGRNLIDYFEKIKQSYVTLSLRNHNNIIIPKNISTVIHLGGLCT